MLPANKREKNCQRQLSFAVDPFLGVWCGGISVSDMSYKCPVVRTIVIKKCEDG